MSPNPCARPSAVRPPAVFQQILGRAGLAWEAKGPGPDRLGLGGQGSWAGPAWLGGPRVLGRAGLGLAWEAKGPGPDRFGFGSIFKKYHI